MMKSRFLLFFLFTTGNCMLNATEICKLIINTVNPNHQSEYYIMSQSTLICEGRHKETDTFIVEIQEPLPCFYIANNDTSKMFIFWIHEGRIEINIDANNIRQTKPNNSNLNFEYYESRRKSDSVYNLVYNSKVLENKYDSLETILNSHILKLNKQWYKEAFKKTNSFLTLKNLKFHLSEYLLKQKEASLSKKQLHKLFKKLDKRMVNYPTYQECVAMFKQKVPKRPVINEPLYK